MEDLLSFLNYDLSRSNAASWIHRHLYRGRSWIRSYPWIGVIRTAAKFALAVTYVVSAFLTIALAAALNTSPPPYFVLDGEHRGISAPEHPAWHQFSDWVHQRKYAVLTFDDGPIGNGLDDQLLDVLRRHHAHAMFFLVCNQIDAKTSSILRKMESEGHLIGNHSFDHKHLSELPYAEVLHQIDACSSRIADVTGHRPYYFRSPFGRSSSGIERAAKTAGVKQVSWNASSYDYWYGEPEKIAAFSIRETSDMSILLMHERKGTVAALDKILTNLEERGFTFVLPEDNLQRNIDS